MVRCCANMIFLVWKLVQLGFYLEVMQIYFILIFLVLGFACYNNLMLNKTFFYGGYVRMIWF